MKFFVQKNYMTQKNTFVRIPVITCLYFLLHFTLSLIIISMWVFKWEEVNNSVHVVTNNKLFKFKKYIYK